MSYEPYIPQTISEIVDLLGGMMLGPPTMQDADFPGRSVETEYFALNEGLKLAREDLGEERYSKLIELSNRMRAHFEADPEDTTGEAHKGYLLIHDMQALLTGRSAQAKP